MCRRNQVHAFILIAFGAGILLGGCFSHGLLRICVGLGGILLGLSLLQKK